MIVRIHTKTAVAYTLHMISFLGYKIYRAANSIFARVGGLASEEVMVQLLKHKCLPICFRSL